VPYWLNEPSNRWVGKVVVEQMGEFGYVLGGQFTTKEIDRRGVSAFRGTESDG